MTENLFACVYKRLKFVYKLYMFISWFIFIFYFHKTNEDTKSNSILCEFMYSRKLREIKAGKSEYIFSLILSFLTKQSFKNVSSPEAL